MQSPVIDHLLRSPEFHRATPLLVACSGGRDSMTLLHALYVSGHTHLHVAHCNFTLRGEESDGDQILVENFCKDRQLPFHTVHFPTSAYARERGISTQMAARELRYEWLEKVRKENDLHLVVVAHNKNDQAETVLLNLIQGTGIHGLKGMLSKNDKIVRPLLQVSREEIDQYVLQHGLLYREDSSNASSHYKRNYIRHEIMPRLKELNSDILEQLSSFSKRMEETALLFNEQVSRIRKKVLVQWKEGYKLHLAYLLAHAAGDTLAHELLTPFGMTAEQVRELMTTAKGFKRQNASGQTFLTRDYRLVMDRKSLYILPVVSDIQSLISYDHWPNQIVFNEYKIDVRLQPVSKVNMTRSERYAYLDADKISFPLQIRYPQQADYFYPFGLGKNRSPDQPGKKKLSKYFKDLKIPVPERERTPVLLGGEKIIWLAGQRIDDRFKVTESTKNVVVLVITKSQ